MNFDDLFGLIVFLGIIIISSIFRGLKEMKKKETEELPKPSPLPPERKFKEPERDVLPRKVVIHKETEPTSYPPPVFIPFPESVETKEDMFEKMEEGEKQVFTPLDKKDYEEPPLREKPTTISLKKDTHTIKIKPKSHRKEDLHSIPRVQKVAFSAPMTRVSTTPQQYSPISLKGNIDYIPKLQWSFIMMEVLQPPKALRDD